MYATLFLGFTFVASLGHTADVAEKTSYCYSKGEGKQPVYVAWKCDQKAGKCRRVRADDGENGDCLTSLNVCNVLCDPHASLWPLPTGSISVQRSLLAVNTGSIAFFRLSDVNNKLRRRLEALEIYFVDVIGYSFEKNEVSKREDGVDLKIKFVLKDKETTTLTYNTTESYHLKIQQSKNNAVDVIIEADNYFGARHAIETLLQLIVFDEISSSLLIPSNADITDAPVYKHRGILLDTSRDYYPVKSIKRLLDGMAYNKLNVFHWHLTDGHSFPFISKTYPEMAAYGAYSPSQVYTRADVSDIVEYASVRGIKVIPELDAPAHVGEGWQYFENDVLLCFKSEPWSKYCVEPPCGFLNPVSERVYEILRNLYAEFNELFDSDVFHMGGDEIKYNCWNETPNVVQWLSDRNLSRSDDNFLHLWGAFQSQAVTELDKSVKDDKKPRIVLWTSLLTESKAVKEFLDPSRYIIQVWTTGQDKQIAELLNNGYEIIMSNYDALYFDCGFGAWIGEGNNWCSPYIGWQKVYMNDVSNLVRKLNDTYRTISHDYTPQILGSEATLWSEQSDQHTLDTRIWPRAAALAERLWTNPSTGWKQAESRMLRQRERMALRNIAPDAIEPLWCHQNEGLCYQ